ncbi:hypothetical protein FTS55_15605 [Salmonella enterica subsp. enterica]|nr:hypothetical protein [Salmonella enterica subsp. enterica serovar Menston]
MVQRYSVLKVIVALKCHSGFIRSDGFTVVFQEIVRIRSGHAGMNVIQAQQDENKDDQRNNTPPFKCFKTEASVFLCHIALPASGFIESEFNRRD